MFQIYFTYTMATKSLIKCEGDEFFKIVKSRSESWCCRICKSFFATLDGAQRHRINGKKT